MESRMRPLEELKPEILRRAGRANPFEWVRREDVEEVVSWLESTEDDHWAEVWSRMGERYEALGANAMRGVADNLDAALADEARRSAAITAAEDGNDGLASALRLLVRERLTGRPVPVDAAALVQRWKARSALRAAGHSTPWLT